MTKWIGGAVVVIIIAVGAWWYRGSVSGLFGGGAAPAPQSQAPADPTAGWGTYASTSMGVSIRYPQGYAVDDSYAYTQVNPKKPISGVAFTVPASLATGTNLAADSYLSVEQLPRANRCTGDIFVAANVAARNVIDGGFSYSVATTTGAAAGNRWEETVYAITDSKPCTAVRYFVHYGALDNYPASAVRQFDQAALLAQFDQVRRTLELTGTASAAAVTP